MPFSCQISHHWRNIVRRERKGLIAWSNVKEGPFCNIYIIISNLQMSFTAAHTTDIMLSAFLVSCPLAAQHMPGPSCIPPSACHPHPICGWGLSDAPHIPARFWSFRQILVPFQWNLPAKISLLPWNLIFWWVHWNSPKNWPEQNGTGMQWPEWTVKIAKYGKFCNFRWEK